LAPAVTGEAGSVTFQQGSTPPEFPASLGLHHVLAPFRQLLGLLTALIGVSPRSITA